MKISIKIIRVSRLSVSCDYDFMHNIFLVALRLGSGASVWRGSEKYVLLYTI